MVAKRSTAGMLPNAIRIVTEKEEFIFTSFLKRNEAFDFIDQCFQEVSYPSQAVLGADDSIN